MARKQKLRVYRTPIGFHDAYVAATSQKAALKAWGADVDLFARGIAETVTEEALTKEPLETPGTVVRRIRGTSEEHMAALPKSPRAGTRRPAPDGDDDGPPPRRRTRTRRSERPAREPAEVAEPEPIRTGAGTMPAKARAARSKPPSRARLDEAEQALEAAQAEHARAMAEIREQERALQQRRRALERGSETATARLEAAVAEARSAYGDALAQWRD